MPPLYSVMYTLLKGDYFCGLIIVLIKLAPFAHIEKNISTLTSPSQNFWQLIETQVQIRIICVLTQVTIAFAREC